jgi:hypothetical protein
MYKDKRMCVKAMLMPEKYELFSKICKELKISKVEQVTNLVNLFIDNHIKRNKKLRKKNML